MKRGRKPTPTALRVLTGNPQHRPLDLREPQPDPSPPRCPSFLSREARKHWREIVPELARLGLLSRVDAGALEGLCDAYSQFRQASEFIKQHGMVYRSSDGQLVKTPHVAIARNALAIYIRIAVEFGLTPSSRTGLQAPEGRADESDAGDLYG